MIILPGGGINENNIAEIVESTGVHECHVSARSPQTSSMRYINPRIYMGKEGMPEDQLLVADAKRIETMYKLAERAYSIRKMK